MLKRFKEIIGLLALSLIFVLASTNATFGSGRARSFEHAENMLWIEFAPIYSVRNVQTNSNEHYVNWLLGD